MSLIDRLKVAEQDDARRLRMVHPSGFEPGVRFVGGQPSEVTVALKEIPEDEQKWRAEIGRVTGLSVPDERRVELAQVRYWGDPESPYVYCRFTISDREVQPEAIDAVDLLKRLRPRKNTQTAFAGDATLVMSINDLQVGKSEGGGTEALAERLDLAYDGVAARARELRKIGRELGSLVILGGGDIVEGCSIFPNQVFNIDSDRRAQMRNAVTFVLEGIDRLAPMFEQVTVLAVGGNHGENRVNGARTNRHDNDDCAVFEHAARATERDPRLGHVNFVIAQDEPAKTLNVHGWVLGTTHGQAFGKGSGSIEQRAWRWYSNQAAGRLPAGDCDVLVTHHYHHLAARDWGACQWLQTPAMDGGSAFYTDFSGQHSEPGMLTFVMTPEARCQDIQVV